jgi:DNA modification methylase
MNEPPLNDSLLKNLVLVPQPPVDTILCGNALSLLRTLPSASVHCIVTSPPYYGLRAYGTAAQVWGGDGDCTHVWGAPQRTAWANEVAGQTSDPGKNTVSHQRAKETGPDCLHCGAWYGELGQEPTPDRYVAHLVAIFREARRVLRADGVCFLNLGDSYAGSWGNYAPGGIKSQQRPQTEQGQRWERRAYGDTSQRPATADVPGLKPKDLIGIPWRVAFALQADGWWLRSDIIWAKPNPMPESVRDRPTRSHEYVFLLTKSERYYYDGEAIREQPAPASLARIAQASFTQQTGGSKDYAQTGVNPNRSARRALEHFAARVGDSRADKQRGHSRPHAGFNDRWDQLSKEQQQAMGCNKRDVWRVATRPFPEAHFAVMPEALVEPCVLAGCPSGGIVLDPFMGAGTVGVVARRHQRHYLGIELNDDYAAMAEKRIARMRQPVLWSTR